MDWWLANFFLGAIFSLFLPIVPDLFVLISLLLLAIFFFSFSLKKSINHSSLADIPDKENLENPLRLSSGLLFGASWMLLSAFDFQSVWQVNEINAIESASKAQWVQGEILSMHSYADNIAALDNTHNNANTSAKTSAMKNTVKPDNADLSNRHIRFNILVSHINKTKLNQAIQIRLSWKKATLALQQGQIVNLHVKFKPTHGLANQGGFSYQTWLNSKKISATGYVINHKGNHIVNSDISVRQQLFNDYIRLLVTDRGEYNLAPLLLALGFGSRTGLTQPLWEVLQVTGTGHLIAISGLHIGLVATGCFYSVMLLLRVFPVHRIVQSQKLQTINFRYVAIGLSMIAAFSYGYLAGFSLPTVRALLMLSFYWLTRLLTLKISIKRWLLLTLFVITLSTPFSLFTASFWLSFYAVIIIFLTLWRFKNSLSAGHAMWRFIKGLVVIQLSLTVMLLPISAVFFQQISLVALFANIIAVPWLSFISIPLCLLSVLMMGVSDTLSQFFISVCLATLNTIWDYLGYLSTMPWAIITLSVGEVQLIVFAGLGAALWLFLQPQFRFVFQGNYKKNQKYKKYISVIGGVLIFTSVVSASYKKLNSNLNHWQLIVFDVGQGLSLLLQQNNRAILYDTGASYDSGFNMIEAVVLPYLQHAGITKLDKVIISHSDNDHAGGLAVLQQSINISELIYNRANNAENGKCLQGRSLVWQNLTIKMLWPDRKVAKENDDSCVLLITDNKHKVLFTGDISKAVENKLIKHYPLLQADVLIVPHHGSKTSSSDDFIEHLNPKIAVVSAGFLNRWHMPVSAVVNRYYERDIQLLNSAISGQIRIDFSEQGFKYSTFHDDLWPFWFAKSL